MISYLKSDQNDDGSGNCVFPYERRIKALGGKGSEHTLHPLTLGKHRSGNHFQNWKETGYFVGPSERGFKHRKDGWFQP